MQLEPRRARYAAKVVYHVIRFTNNTIRLTNAAYRYATAKLILFAYNSSQFRAVRS